MIIRKWVVIVVTVLSFLLLVACTAVAEPDAVASPTVAADNIVPTTVPDITPTTESVQEATAVPTETAAAVEDLASFTSSLQTALAQRDFTAAQAQMSDPFGFGPYRSEWSLLTPAEMVPQLEMVLPQGAALQFNPEADFMGMLDGQDPQMMMGPDVMVVAVWHSAGWGAEGQDEAILFIEELADGRFVWKALLYAPDGFLPASAELPILDEQPAPIGLLYSQPDGSLWQVDADGQPVQLWYQEGTPATPSPDGKHAYYQIQGDLFVLDVTTGESRQLASDHDDQGTHLVGFHLWVNNTTILSSVLLDREESGPNFGHPALVDIDTGDVTFIDTEHLLSSLPAISDSGAIAYSTVPQSADDTETTWIYRPESGVISFNVADYDGAPELFYGSPGWSPDERYLAWLGSDGINVQLTVFDLEGNSAFAQEPFGGAPFGGARPNPIFSEDGNWIALRQLTNAPGNDGLWLYTQDGQPPLFLAHNGGESFWANDHLLLFLDYDENFNAQLQQYNVATGVRSVVTLPDVFQIFGIATP
ncbi:MAG: hypothetical protein DHS20C20_22730 [Ardenticatenaceae bacterium]|nr:MAG: hypothetical protein DHS20C20_22730 [Ardenticatenaceae bacterium]